MKLLKRILPIILVLVMLGGTIISAFALPAFAADDTTKTRAIPNQDEIKMSKISGYPRIQFLKNGDVLFQGADGADNNGYIYINSDKLSFNANSVKYGNSSYTQYDSIKILFAVADKNTSVGDYGVDENTIDAQVHFGRETYQGKAPYTGSTVANGSLVVFFIVDDLSFDDLNNEVTVDLAYEKTEKTGTGTGTTYRCTGEKTFTFTNAEIPDKPNDGNNNNNGSGDVNFGNGDNNNNNNNNGDTTPDIKSSTPYIIIEEYSTGGTQAVSAGSSFPLTITCRNTHTRTNLDNIIMKVTTSDGLQITNSSNTFYIKSLKKNSSFQKQLQISALPNAEAKSHTISISFTYEYVADDARQKGEMSQEISIPVIQQDRFSADPVSEIMQTTVGEETYITAKYINKSRGDIYNLTATLEANEPITCTERTVHKGNVVAGGSSEVEFSISSTEAGTFEGAIVYTYEDSMANVKEVRVPFQATFQEAPNYDYNPIPDMPVDNGIIYDEFGNPIDPNAPQGLQKWQTGAIVGGVIIAVIVVSVIIVKKRKAAKEFEDDDENI